MLNRQAKVPVSRISSTCFNGQFNGFLIPNKILSAPRAASSTRHEYPVVWHNARHRGNTILIKIRCDIRSNCDFRNIRRLLKLQNPQNPLFSLPRTTRIQALCMRECSTPKRQSPYLSKNWSLGPRVKPKPYHLIAFREKSKHTEIRCSQNPSSQAYRFSRLT